MKPVRTEIERILRGKAIQTKQLDELLSHLAVKSFMKQNPNIPMDAYKRSLPKIAQFVQEKENCAKCQGLETCKNLYAGYTSELVGYETYIDIQMKKCQRLEQYEQMQKRQKLLKSYEIPKSVLSATFDSIDVDDDRVEAIEIAMEYCNLFDKGVVPKHGLYFHGKFGVGKSHICAAICNYLTNKGIDSFMVYVPDFVQMVYHSIKENNTNELLEAVKRTTVLVLDDIGSEDLNPWIRDGVLGAILQARTANELPTLYTSNLTLDELEEHLAFTNKGGHEQTKAARIMERIRHYVKPVLVKGKNRREGMVL